MSVTVAVWLVVGLLTLVVMVVLVVSLARQLRGLATTVSRFQEEITPVASDIAAEADRASVKAGELQRKAPGGRP